jgi:signal transduction histidine kinase
MRHGHTLKKYTEEMETIYSGIQFEHSLEAAELQPSSTILALAACELIDNAVSALSEKGQIRVEFSTMVGVGHYRLMVQDHGPGVPPDHQQHLFDEGFSTKGPGRGLGLKLVRAVVDRVGGKVDYRAHQGACFTVLVPIDAVARV